MSVQVRFSNAAELARGEIAGGARLLDGCRVYIYAQDQPKKGLPSNMQALKRVTAALGGKVNRRKIIGTGSSCVGPAIKDLSGHASSGQQGQSILSHASSH